MRRRILLVGWLVVLGISAALPLSAVFRGVLHFGPGPIRVHGVLTTPLIAVGSDVYLPSGSHAIVVTIDGDIHASGSTTDDLVAMDGRIYLSPRSRVAGDVLSVLGGIYRAQGATVNGRVGGAVHRWDGRSAADHRSIASLVANSIRLGLAAGLALLLAGACLTIVFPWQVVVISSTLRSSPVKSIAAGIMAVLTFMFLVVPLGLSLAGLPFALLLTAAASLAWLFGLTAVAVVVGRSIAHGPVSLLWAAAAGLVALSLAMAVPVVGPVVVTLTGLLGAGALAVSLISRARPSAPMP
jgi:hypothetical protein